MFMNPEDKLNRPEHNWHGSAIAWHHTLDTITENTPSVNERFSGVKLNFSNCKILAISVYFPTCGKDDEFLECIANLSNYIAENQHDREILIGTDSNCSEKSSSRRRKSFSIFCIEFSLTKYECSTPTFHHPNGTSESSIDYFLMSAKSKQNLTNLLSSCTLNNPLNFSSLLHWKFKRTPQMTKQQFPPQYIPSLNRKELSGIWRMFINMKNLQHNFYPNVI